MFASGPGFRVRVPAERAKVLGNSLGKEVVFGIRPEDIHDREFSPPGITAETLTCSVDVTELMGSEVYVYLVSDSQTFIGRFDPRTKARVGQKVDVAFDMANVHFFDKESERALR
jgi:multiple sugar transport system ATP-binding protein